MKKLLVTGKNGTPQFRFLNSLEDFYQMEVVELPPTKTDAEAMLAWDIKKDQLEELVKNSPSLKWIHTKSAGVESLLSPGLIQSPVTLTNAQGVFADSLAEFAVTGMLLFAKDIQRMNLNKAKKQWVTFEVDCLKNSTVGILGYGGIGQQIARRCLAFGMEVIAFRTKVKNEGEVVDGVKIYPVSRFDEFAVKFDYLASSMPATPETKNFLDAKRISMLKPSAVFVNVGRGTTVDEEALIKALKDKKIRGAALDVFAVEPLPESSPLWELENVLLSPHTADRTATWLDETMQKFVSNAELYARNKPVENVVDKSRGY